MSSIRVLERTFVHLPGIGRQTESILWSNGIQTWDALAVALRSGVSPGQLRQAAGRRQSQASRRQLMLFNASQEPLHPTVVTWLRLIEDSRAALQKHNIHFFLSRLSPRDHWRVLLPHLNEALYLDIETTGLSIHYNQVTVIGALYKRKFYQWVWPERIDELANMLEVAPLVVTYNGARFDLPFLQARLPTLPQPSAHVDLRPIASDCKVVGGQKALERHFNIARGDDLVDVDGATAVALWCNAAYGDSESYKLLLHYNRADVENLSHLAARLCQSKLDQIGARNNKQTVRAIPKSRLGRRLARYSVIRRAWNERRASLDALLPRVEDSRGNIPRVVGIDLRGNPKNPTGLACCHGSKVQTRVVFNDDEIIESTLAEQPRLVSIDAPLALPRGRSSVYDDSPCRDAGGIVRDAERILWSRKINVYPALIRHMQSLTRRGIFLAERLRSYGIEVIESYPGAAQDILGIPRKKASLDTLANGLKEFGFDIRDQVTHDELDAVTSAMVGYFYLANCYEGVGADDECYLIVPMWPSSKNWD